MSLLSSPPVAAGSSPLPQPKPLLRRSTLVRKREDDGEGNIPSSPGKKARVTFDSDVEVRLVPEAQDPPELIREEVRQAFEKRKWGDNSEYERLKDMYSPREGAGRESAEVIKKHTMGLLSNVTYLNKDNADFVRALIRSKWLGMSDDYVSLYIRLLANIVSAQGMFANDALKMLVENLSIKPPSNSPIFDRPVVSSSKAYSRVHKALQYMIGSLPSTVKLFVSTMASVFPHHSESARAHVVYIKNLLRVPEYATYLRGHVLSLITERLVKIDVQVQVDLEDMTDEVGESLVDSVPEMKPGLLEDLNESDFSDSDSEDDEDDEEVDDEYRRSRDVRRNVEKMDLMLDVLFTYYDSTFAQQTSPDVEAKVIKSLMAHFSSIILPTHRSRHTQFLLFHFIQRSPTHMDSFVAICTQAIFDKKPAEITRQSAAAYLASFVARGMHVPAATVLDVFDFLGEETSKLRQASEASCRGPDLRRYSSYYCLVQAMLYIFCFRWRDLEITSEEQNSNCFRSASTSYGQLHRWHSGVKEALSVNVFSKLNPLKVCSPAIVNEFARIANHLSIVYVYHVLETNKLIKLSHTPRPSGYDYKYGLMAARETALSTITDESYLHLDEYFPFDPYHLPRSKRWLEGDYREWTGIPGLDDQETEDSTSADEEDDDAEYEGEEEGTETDHTGRIS